MNAMLPPDIPPTQPAQPPVQEPPQPDIPPQHDPTPAPVPPEQPPHEQPPVQEPPVPQSLAELPPVQEPPRQFLQPSPMPSQQQQAYKQAQTQYAQAPAAQVLAALPAPAPVQPVARYSVIHQTDYNYRSVVTLSQQYLHLTPRNFDYQQTISHQIQIDPVPEDTGDSLDYFANATRKITVTIPHQMLIVRTESVVDVYPRPGTQQIGGGEAWESLKDAMRHSQGVANLDPYQYLYNSPHIQCSDTLREYALRSFTPGRPLLEAALDLTCRITDEFQFDPDATNIHTTLDEVLQGRRGVCQDFAHMMIGCLRTLGLPARYVSGYILTHPPEGQARLIGADASHAWASLWSPAFGWVDFDPTNRCLVQHEHITLGWGRDYSDVTPLRGIVLGGGAQLLGVSVTVTPITQGQNNLI